MIVPIIPPAVFGVEVSPLMVFFIPATISFPRLKASFVFSIAASAIAEYGFDLAPVFAAFFPTSAPTLAPVFAADFPASAPAFAPCFPASAPAFAPWDAPAVAPALVLPAFALFPEFTFSEPGFAFNFFSFGLSKEEPCPFPEGAELLFPLSFPSFTNLLMVSGEGPEDEPCSCSCSCSGSL